MSGTVAPMRVRARVLHTSGVRRTVWLRMSTPELPRTEATLRASVRAHLAYLQPSYGPPESWMVPQLDYFCQCVQFAHHHTGTGDDD